MSHFKIQFNVFEGPMDLLLFLVKKQEVDIYEVNMTELATQFIDYVELMQHLDLELAGEFIVMASTLMYIKSRELLPIAEQVEDPGEDEADEPRAGSSSTGGSRTPRKTCKGWKSSGKTFTHGGPGASRSTRCRRASGSRPAFSTSSRP